MFRGKSDHVLDSKGRLSIPARFRDFLKTKGDERLMVTNKVNCLVAYPFDEWRILEDHFIDSSKPFQDPDTEAFQRYFIAAAVECTPDSQGRILIPAPLREEVGLKKDVVLAGMLRYFEIWDRKQHRETMEKVRENFGRHYSTVSGK